MTRPSPAVAEEVAALPDEVIRSGLWNFPPSWAEAVMHERRRRFPGEFEDPEEMFDPEYH